jgi:hypothetical protein
VPRAAPEIADCLSIVNVLLLGLEGRSASYGIPDLVHAVVIEVLEHALKKNIDWFTMSKELEEEGFKNA